MSHFTVLVIGENPEEQLQPYHEYECTGIEDEYVKFVPTDESLEEMRGTYEENKNNYPTFDEFVTDWYGYTKEGNVWGRKTNPNRKWDWYKLGGRWTGFFRLKNDADGEIGEPGLMTARAKVGFADAALKKDIDFAYMQNEKAQKAAKEYDKAMKVIGHLPVNKTWEAMRTEIADIDKARTVYWEQERCKAWQSNKNMHEDFSYDSSPDDYLIPKEQFVAEAKERAITTFAVVKDSQWYEKGKMGWFAFTSNEKEQSVWNKEFFKLLNELPEDTLLSLYDCHI